MDIKCFLSFDVSAPLKADLITGVPNMHIPLVSPCATPGTAALVAGYLIAFRVPAVRPDMLPSSPPSPLSSQDNPSELPRPAPAIAGKRCSWSSPVSRTLGRVGVKRLSHCSVWEAALLLRPLIIQFLVEMFHITLAFGTASSRCSNSPACLRAQPREPFRSAGAALPLHLTGLEMPSALFRACSSTFPFLVASAAPCLLCPEHGRYRALRRGLTMSPGVCCPGSAVAHRFHIPLGPALPHLGLTWVAPLVSRWPSPTLLGHPVPASPLGWCLDLPCSPSLAQSAACCFLHISEPAHVLRALGGPTLAAARSVAWIVKIWVFVCSSGTLFSPIPSVPVLHLCLLLEFLAQVMG